MQVRTIKIINWYKKWNLIFFFLILSVGNISGMSIMSVGLVRWVSNKSTYMQRNFSPLFAVKSLLAVRMWSRCEARNIGVTRLCLILVDNPIFNFNTHHKDITVVVFRRIWGWHTDVRTKKCPCFNFFFCEDAISVNRWLSYAQYPRKR